VIHRAADILLTCCIVIFAFVGLVFLPIRAELRVLFLAFLIYMIALHSVSFAIPRLALPIFPLLMVIASGSVSALPFPGRKKLWLIASLLSACACLCLCFGQRGTDRSIADETALNGFTEKYEVSLQAPTNVLPPGALEDQGITLRAGEEPAIIPFTPPFIAKQHQVLFLEVSAKKGSGNRKEAVVLHFSWTDERSNGFDEARSNAIAVPSDGKYRWQRITTAFSPTWSGPTGALRLRVDKHAKKARVHVRRMVIGY